MLMAETSLLTCFKGVLENSGTEKEAICQVIYDYRPNKLGWAGVNT